MDTSVLVVGGGPVGLGTAIGLRRWNIPCIVVERHPGLLTHPKGRGITIRTLEQLRRWGLEEEVRAAGLPPSHLAVYIGETLTAPDYQRLGGSGRADGAYSPARRLACTQDAFEPILRHEAERLGADVRFSTRLTAFKDDGAGVSAELVDEQTGRLQTLRASYLIGADGAHSTVRTLLEIPTSGPDLDRTTVSILFEASLRDAVAGRESILYRIQGGSFVCGFAAIDNDRRWALMYDYDPTIEQRVDFTEQRCAQMVRTAVGIADLELQLVGVKFFRIRAQLADRYGQGRVFLAGDAAHQITPAGGLGMNCGMQDAETLVWQLAGVLQGWGGPGLLRGYEPERRPVGQWCMETSYRKLLEPESPTRLVVEGVATGYSYDSPLIMSDGTAPPLCDDPVAEYVPVGRPGHRAPYVRLADGRSTVDLFGDRFVLLTETASFETPTTEVPLHVHCADNIAEAYGLREGTSRGAAPDPLP